ncbi:uncharacterized protein LOC128720997 [Anopheles nili]|uniref:uncharacterized protein LOC128720997 n=1 Tax=Anopheles nili TaxID=185578 RepID=UPI00237BE6E4|nr:uncharacterized protein LOC128720997 [Anopheles nili]
MQHIKGKNSSGSSKSDDSQTTLRKYDDDDEGEIVDMEHKFALDLRLETGSKGRPKLILGGYAFFRNNFAASSLSKKRTADYRNNPDEFVLPDPVRPGVSAIRAYKPVVKIDNTDVVHRMLASTFTPNKEKDAHRPAVTHARKTSAPVLSKAGTNVSRNQCEDVVPMTGSHRESKKIRAALNFAEITEQQPVEMALIPTRKGATGVQCAGHHFEFHYTRKQHKIYRCALHSARRCQAQVLMHNKLFYIVHGEHTHTEFSKLSSDVLGKTTLKQ